VHEVLIRLTSNQLQAGGNDAHSDDTCRITIAIADWLNTCNPLNTDLEAHKTMLSTRGKEDRGYSNDVTGHLLCLIDYDWDDLEYVQVDCLYFNLSISVLVLFLNFLFSVRAKLWNAAPEYDFASSFLLRCLYHGEEGDPERPHISFLKGPLLLYVSSLASH